VTHILDAYRVVLPMLKAAIDRGDLKSELRGQPLEPVFRKTSNFNVKPKRAT
jgi:glutamate-1-semialdehyde 2,1-aminomutase